MPLPIWFSRASKRLSPSAHFDKKKCGRQKNSAKSGLFSLKVLMLFRYKIQQAATFHASMQRLLPVCFQTDRRNKKNSFKLNRQE